MSKLLTLAILCMTIMPQSSFRQMQRDFERVEAAYIEKESRVRQLFTAKKINPEKFELFLRALKKEMKLETWVRPNGQETFVLLNTYEFCSTSGTVGPKRKEGDLQIPEGIYYINHFNPVSDFHLSLGINYPNESDRILSDKKRPGSAIYIHGNCVTVGCIPITDDKIKELYVLAVEARNAGQEKIPVHIFPANLSNDQLSNLRATVGASSVLTSFWKNLQVIFQDFERTRKVKPVRVNSKGEYYF